MVDYEKNRKNMVECQLQTNNVISPAILEAFRTVPRELFVPEAMRSLACVDEDLALPGGGCLMEPVTFGRMIEVAQPRPSDIVLNIGDCTGYSSALLSGLVTTIVALECRSGQFDAARPIWAQKDFCNIAVIGGEDQKGCAKHAPYDLIIINGAVPEVPASVKAQLAAGGRLVTVIKPPGSRTGKITLIQRAGEGSYTSQKFYDAATPYLKAFQSEPVFVF